MPISPSSTSTYNNFVNFLATFFQLKLSGVSDCINWRNDAISEKDMDIAEAIAANVALRCGCDFTEEHITNRVFQCFPSSPNTVTYHAQLHNTPQASASQLLTVMQEWATSTDTIAVNFLPLTMDSICTEALSSPQETCPDDVLQSKPTTSNVTSDRSTLIAAATAVAVLVVLIACTAVVVALVVMFRKKRSKNETTWSPPAASKTTEQDNAFTGLNDPPYEEIAMYRKIGETVPKCSAKEFAVSQCPAYSSLPKSACLPECEYDEVRTVTTHGQRVMSHMRTPKDYESVQGSREINMA